MAATPVGPVAVSQRMPGGDKGYLGITGAGQLVKTGAGVLCKVSVIVAGSAAGTLNDVATVGGAAAANQFGTIPNTVGTYEFDWPCATGIVVVPGTGQTVAVSYS